MILSPLPKTWLLDVDGTILKHNGYKTGGDEVLSGVKKFFANLSAEDKIIFLTARPKEEKKSLERLLKQNKIRFDKIIYDITVGERILVNDRKPSGLKTAFAVNKKRDAKFSVRYKTDGGL
ncbi:MAG: HAD family acid phosphatase [Elusimicrobiota bacterium]|jgi:ribonucleotide monophosphatase NagD (HAD superfamily)|nr:HAD family acid phosphatase [Elusimicrobiota bacterium]